MYLDFLDYQYSRQFLERDYKLYSTRIINKVQLNTTSGVDLTLI
jgi:hypothetical protein